MGYYLATNDRGEEFGFIIRGEQPSQTELLRAQKYMSGIQKPKPEPEEESSSLGGVGTFFKEAGRGFGSSFTEAPAGIIGLLEEGAGIKRGSTAVGGAAQDFAEAGEAFFTDILGEPEDSISAKSGQAIGSIASFLVPGMAAAKGAKLLGALSKGQKIAGLAGAGTMGVGLGSKEQMNRIAQKLESGTYISDDAQRLSILQGGAIGATEIMPGTAVVRGLGQILKILKKVPKELKKEAFDTIAKRLKSAGKAGLGEGLQEATAGIMQDLVEKGMYNPDLQVGQSALDDATYGGGAGFALSFLLDSIRGRQLSTRNKAVTDAVADAKVEVDNLTHQLANIEANVERRVEGISGEESVVELKARLQKAQEAVRAAAERETEVEQEGTITKTGFDGEEYEGSRALTYNPVTEVRGVPKDEAAKEAFDDYGTYQGRFTREEYRQAQELARLAALAKRSDGEQTADIPNSQELEAMFPGIGSKAIDKLKKMMLKGDGEITLQNIMDTLNVKYHPARQIKEKLLKDNHITKSQTGKMVANPSYGTQGRATADPKLEVEHQVISAESRIDGEPVFAVVEQQYDNHTLVYSNALATFKTKAEADAMLEAMQGKNPETDRKVLTAALKEADDELNAYIDMRQNEIFDEEVAPLQKLLNALTKSRGMEDIDIKAVARIQAPKGEVGLAEGVTTIRLEKDKSFKHVVRIAVDYINSNLGDAAQAKAIIDVFNHESIHALKNMGVITDKEWKALTNLANTKKRAGKTYTHTQWAMARTAGQKGMTGEKVMEEAVAEMFRYEQAALNAPAQVKSVLRKIIDFFKKIAGIFKSTPAGERVLEAIRTGEMGRRTRPKINPEIAARPKYSLKIETFSFRDYRSGGVESRDILFGVTPTEPQLRKLRDESTFKTIRIAISRDEKEFYAWKAEDAIHAEIVPQLGMNYGTGEGGEFTQLETDEDIKRFIEQWKKFVGKDPEPGIDILSIKELAKQTTQEPESTIEDRTIVDEDFDDSIMDSINDVFDDPYAKFSKILEPFPNVMQRVGLNEEFGEVKLELKSLALTKARDFKGKAQSASDWLNYLKNQGVLIQEIKWTGLEDWLNTYSSPREPDLFSDRKRVKSKSIPKEEVVQFLEANYVPLREIILEEITDNHPVNMERESLIKEYGELLDSHGLSIEEIDKSTSAASMSSRLDVPGWMGEEGKPRHTPEDAYYRDVLSEFLGFDNPTSIYYKSNLEDRSMSDERLLRSFPEFKTLKENPEVRSSLRDKLDEYSLRWIDNYRRKATELEKKGPQYKKWLGRPGSGDVLEMEPGDPGSYKNVLITIPMVHTLDTESGPPYSATYINPEHWDGVANIIVSVLMDTKGNAVRILEIQSVYHQKGNKVGYGAPKTQYMMFIDTFPYQYQDEMSNQQSKIEILKTTILENHLTNIGPIEYTKKIHPDISNSVSLTIIREKSGYDTTQYIERMLEELGVPKYEWFSFDFDSIAGENKKEQFRNAEKKINLLSKIRNDIGNESFPINFDKGNIYDTEEETDNVIDKMRNTYDPDRILPNDLFNFHSTEFLTEPMPEAPFKDTKEWGQLAIRRMIKYAVDNSYATLQLPKTKILVNRWEMGLDAKGIKTLERTYDSYLKYTNKLGKQFNTSLVDGGKFFMDLPLTSEMFNTARSDKANPLTRQFSFISEQSSVARPEAGRAAKAMTFGGAIPDEVWATTWDMYGQGWYLNPIDNLWRIELSDDKAKYDFESFRTFRLGQALEHPELLASNKTLGKIKLEQQSKLWPGQGSYQEATSKQWSSGEQIDVGTHYKNAKYFLNDEKAWESRKRQETSVALHEVQHALQARYGFSKGSSPEIEKTNIVENRQYWDLVDDISRERTNKTFKGLEKIHRETPSKHELSMIRIMDEIIEETNNKVALDQYKRQAGEVEANNVQTRMGMTPEERRAKPPWETQSVPYENQLTKMPPNPEDVINDWAKSHHGIEKKQTAGYQHIYGDDYKFSLISPGSTQDKIERLTTYNNVAPRLAGFLGKFPGVDKEEAQRKTEYALILLQDRMLSIGKLIDEIREAGGVVTQETDTYFRETLFSGITDDRITTADKEMYAPLVKAVNDMTFTKADKERVSRLNEAAHIVINNYVSPNQAMSELYIYAMHAEERNAKMRERNRKVFEKTGKRAKQFDYGSGMKDAEAQQIIAWFRTDARHGEVEGIRLRVRAIIDHTNDTRVEGKLSPEFRGTEYDVYKNYVPIRSKTDEALDPLESYDVNFARAGKGFKIRGKEDFSALGRGSLGAHILEHVILQNEEAILRAEKNRVGESFLSLLEANPDVLEGIATIHEFVPTRWGLVNGVVRRVSDPMFKGRDDVLVVKRGDREISIEFNKTPNAQRIAKALAGRTSAGSPAKEAALGGLMRINRFLAAVRTSYNPEFMLSNPIRDAFTALTNLSEFEGGEIDIEGLKSEVMKNLPKAWSGLKEVLRDGTAEGEWAKIFKDARKHGFMTAFYGIRELGDSVKNTNDILSDDLSGTNLAKSKNAVRQVGKFIEDYNLVMENGIRVAVWKTMVDKLTNGSTDPAVIKEAKERAAFIAKKLTINFNMGGELKPFLGSLYLFYNAGMAGSFAIVDPLIRSKKVRRIWGGIFAAGIMQDVLMNLISPDDDEGKNPYDQIPDYIHETNMVFMDPFGFTNRGYMKIPLPYGLNAVYNAGRAMAKGVRGGATAGETSSSVLGGIFEAFNPMSGSHSFMNFAAPTVVDPFIDVIRNKNFMNRPIYPGENPFGTDRVASQRHWNNTSPAYVVPAQWLSKITGGGEYIPGSIGGLSTEISPDTLKYMVEFVFGGSGSFVRRSIDLGTKTLPELIAGDLADFEFNDVVIARRFLGNISSRNDMEFYMKNRDKVGRIKMEIKAAKERGDSKAVLELINKYPKEFRISGLFNNIERSRRRLNKQIRTIRDSENLPDDVKKELVKSLKERIDRLIGIANQRSADL